MKRILIILLILPVFLIGEDEYPYLSDPIKLMKFQKSKIDIIDYYENGYQSTDKERDVLSIKIDNKIKKINPQEKKVLGKMLQSPGKIFSRDEIGKMINISKERTIDVVITRLRQKIESNPKNPKYLQTIRGSGYVLWIE